MHKLFLSVDPKQSSGNVTKLFNIFMKVLYIETSLSHAIVLNSAKVMDSLSPADFQVDCSFAKVTMNIKVVSTSTFSYKGQILEI